MNNRLASCITRPRPVRSPVSRAVAGAILAIGLAVGSLTIATPAHAATAVSFCLKWSTGAAYASQPVQLQRWDGYKWATIRSGRTNAQGCGTFYRTPTDVHLIVNGHAVLNYGGWHGVWTGWTPKSASPGSGGVNLGTGIVAYQYGY